jgi:predicted metal-dependent hydrolase
MLKLLRQNFPEAVETEVDGRAVAVVVRISQRARNYRLSIPHSGGPVLTIPAHGRWAEAESFLRRHTGWLAARLERAPRPVAFVTGAIVPVRGVPHRIRGTGRVRGQVEVERGEGQAILHVPGTPEHRPRRLVDWLKAEAERDLRRRVGVHARALGVTVKAVRLRAQSTRWGSCSSRGSLSFNWRLILAPPFVLDYVAAHEVAHLVEMNHSAAFWRTVARICPNTERGRAWLRAHGAELMAYGTPD